MSRSKRKPVRRTVPDVRAVTARPVEVVSRLTQGYPSANALVASGEAWRAWLDEALRRVLAPAAIAGALGVAAAGCTIPGVSLDPFGAAVTTAPRVDKPGASPAPAVTLVPLGPPTSPSPAPTSAQLIVPSPVPQPPATQPVPPRRPPARHPPAMRGGAPAMVLPARPIAPQPDPPSIEGGMASVRVVPI